jgi:serine/threonine protein kinase
MSGRRPPSVPPRLDGLEPVKLIGSGGYADVFLYEQQMPARQVAVKVLVGDDIASSSFTAEANLMARVSAHPYIVTIFDARLAPDGRPYLVMEYYPGANFLDRARRERFAVADALRVGVQVGSALETAHRAGILHRDIKPANILTSEYGRPGLTDFGIAAAEGPGHEADGVSIPWSPREALRDASIDARSDVYSLAASVYHLLAGRSPFEVPGGKNSPLDLMTRIEREPVPPIGRNDIPANLERLLSQSMSKDPAHRPASVAEFARSLQTVESELRLSMTPLELPDVDRKFRDRNESTDDGDETRVRGVTEITAQPTAPSVIGEVPESATDLDQTFARRGLRERQGILAEPVVSDTVHRPTQPEATPAAELAKQNWAVICGAAAVLLLVAVLATVLFGGGGSGSSESSESTVLSIGAPLEVQFLTAVTDLAGETNEQSVVFSWTAENSEPGDTYVFTRRSDGRSVTGRSPIPEVLFSDAEIGVEECLAVVVTRDGFSDSASNKTCVTP